MSSSETVPVAEPDAAVGGAGNLKLIIITSSIGGAIVFVLISYIAIRLYRGHRISDIVRFRHPRAEEYDNVPDLPEVTESGPVIRTTKRYSVRSWRASKPGSIYSRRSRNADGSRDRLSSTLGPRRQASQQSLVPHGPKRPPPIRIVPAEPQSKIVGSFLVSPTSTLIGSSALSPPQTGYLPTSTNTTFSRLTPIDTGFSALPQMVKIEKPGLTKTIHIMPRGVEDMQSVPKRALSRSLRSLRWSGSTGELPPTPRLALERCPSTGSRKAALRVAGKGKAKSSRSSPRSTLALESRPSSARPVSSRPTTARPVSQKSGAGRKRP